MSARKKGNKPGAMTLRRKQLVEDAATKMSRQVSEWMDVVVPQVAVASTHQTKGATELDDLMLSIADGVRLCRLIKKIDPGHPLVYHTDAKAGSFQARENITLFTGAARTLGVPSTSLFEANDITARTNDSAIVTSLTYLSRIAHKRQQIAPPPIVKAEMDAEAESDAKRSSALDQKYKDGSEPGLKDPLESNDGEIPSPPRAAVAAADKAIVKDNGNVNIGKSKGNGNVSNSNGNGRMNGHGVDHGDTNGTGSNSDTSPPLSPLNGQSIVNGRSNLSNVFGVVNGDAKPKGRAAPIPSTSARRASRDEGQPESLWHHLGQLRATMTWRKLLTIIIAFPFWAVMEVAPLVRQAIGQIPVLFQQFRVYIRLQVSNVIELIRNRQRRLRQRIVAMMLSAKLAVYAGVDRCYSKVLSWYAWFASLYVKYVRQPINRIRIAIVKQIQLTVSWIRSSITSIRSYITATINTYIIAPLQRVRNYVLGQVKRVKDQIIALLRRYVIEPISRVAASLVTILRGIRDSVVTRLVAIRGIIATKIKAVILYARTQATRLVTWSLNAVKSVGASVYERVYVPLMNNAKRIAQWSIHQIKSWSAYIYALNVSIVEYGIDRTWLIIQLWAECIAFPIYQLTERAVIWSWNNVVLPLNARAIVVWNRVSARISSVIAVWRQRVGAIVARARVLLGAIKERINRLRTYITEQRRAAIKYIGRQLTWASGVLRSLAARVYQTLIQPVIAVMTQIASAIGSQVRELAGVARQLLSWVKLQFQSVRASFAEFIAPLMVAIKGTIVDARTVLIQMYTAITAVAIASRRDARIILISIRDSLTAVLKSLSQGIPRA